MQALILCRGNIRGIRSNPEGYDGALPAPQSCNPACLPSYGAGIQLRDRFCANRRILLLERLTID